MKILLSNPWATRSNTAGQIYGHSLIDYDNNVTIDIVDVNKFFKYNYYIRIYGAEFSSPGPILDFLIENSYHKDPLMFMEKINYSAKLENTLSTEKKFLVDFLINKCNFVQLTPKQELLL